MRSADSGAIEELLDDPETDPKITRRNLIKALGIVRRSAQVKDMSFEQRPDGAMVATVISTVSPFKTRWVKIENRWRLVGQNDFPRAIELAVPQQDDQGITEIAVRPNSSSSSTRPIAA